MHTYAKPKSGTEFRLVSLAQLLDQQALDDLGGGAILLDRCQPQLLVQRLRELDGQPPLPFRCKECSLFSSSLFRACFFSRRASLSECQRRR
mgnify:CR=1 FL=1